MLELPSSGAVSSSLSSWSAGPCFSCFLALVPLVPGPGRTADIFLKDGTNEGLGTGIPELFIKSDVLIEVGGENSVVFRVLFQPVARICMLSAQGLPTLRSSRADGDYAQGQGSPRDYWTF